MHFIGLTLLCGTIAVWDLHLLGFADHVPITDFHRLVFEMLLVMLAGLNVAVFYLTLFRRLKALAPGVGTPRSVRLFGALSLIRWTGGRRSCP